VTGEKPDSATPAPATLVWAVRLLLLQAAGMAALTVYLVVRLLTASEVIVGVASALIVTAALAAVVIAVVARSLSRRAHGARGPAIVVQLFVIATGGFLVQTEPVWLGLLLMAFGIAVGVLVVAPASTRALGVD
jgi:hypothetical protein